MCMLCYPHVHVQTAVLGLWWVFHPYLTLFITGQFASIYGPIIYFHINLLIVEMYLPRQGCCCLQYDNKLQVPYNHGIHGPCRHSNLHRLCSPQSLFTSYHAAAYSSSYKWAQTTQKTRRSRTLSLVHVLCIKVTNIKYAYMYSIEIFALGTCSPKTSPVTDRAACRQTRLTMSLAPSP
jgi:hypothetical protein